MSANPLLNRMFQGDRSRKGRREVLQKRKVQAQSRIAKIGEAAPPEEKVPRLTIQRSLVQINSKKPVFKQEESEIQGSEISQNNTNGSRTILKPRVFKPQPRSCQQNTISLMHPILSEAGCAQGHKNGDKAFSVTTNSKHDSYEVEVINNSGYPIVDMRACQKPRCVIFCCKKEEGEEESIAVPVPSAYDLPETRLIHVSELTQGRCFLRIPTSNKGQLGPIAADLKTVTVTASGQKVADLQIPLNATIKGPITTCTTTWSMFEPEQMVRGGKYEKIEREKVMREKFTDKVSGVGRSGKDKEGDASPIRRNRIVDVTLKVNNQMPSGIVLPSCPKKKLTTDVTSKVTHTTDLDSQTNNSDSTNALNSKSKKEVSTKVTNTPRSMGGKSFTSDVRASANFNNNQNAGNQNLKVTQICQDGKSEDRGGRLGQTQDEYAFFLGYGQKDTDKRNSLGIGSGNSDMINKNNNLMNGNANNSAKNKSQQLSLSESMEKAAISDCENAGIGGSGNSCTIKEDSDSDPFSFYCNVKKHSWQAEVNCRYSNMEWQNMSKFRTIGFTCKNKEGKPRSMKLVVPQCYDVSKANLTFSNDKKIIITCPINTGGFGLTDGSV